MMIKPQMITTVQSIYVNKEIVHISFYHLNIFVIDITSLIDILMVK